MAANFSLSLSDRDLTDNYRDIESDHSSPRSTLHPRGDTPLFSPGRWSVNGSSNNVPPSPGGSSVAGGGKGNMSRLDELLKFLDEDEAEKRPRVNGLARSVSSAAGFEMPTPTRSGASSKTVTASGTPSSGSTAWEGMPIPPKLQIDTKRAQDSRSSSVPILSTAESRRASLKSPIPPFPQSPSPSPRFPAQTDPTLPIGANLISRSNSVPLQLHTSANGPNLLLRRLSSASNPTAAAGGRPSGNTDVNVTTALSTERIPATHSSQPGVPSESSTTTTKQKESPLQTSTPYRPSDNEQQGHLQDSPEQMISPIQPRRRQSPPYSSGGRHAPLPDADTTGTTFTPGTHAYAPPFSAPPQPQASASWPSRRFPGDKGYVPVAGKEDVSIGQGVDRLATSVPLPRRSQVPSYNRPTQNFQFPSPSPPRAKASDESGGQARYDVSRPSEPFISFDSEHTARPEPRLDPKPEPGPGPSTMEYRSNSQFSPPQAVQHTTRHSQYPSTTTNDSLRRPASVDSSIAAPSSRHHGTNRTYDSFVRRPTPIRSSIAGMRIAETIQEEESGTFGKGSGEGLVEQEAREEFESIVSGQSRIDPPPEHRSLREVTQAWHDSMMQEKYEGHGRQDNVPQHTSDSPPQPGVSSAGDWDNRRSIGRSGSYQVPLQSYPPAPVSETMGRSREDREWIEERRALSRELEEARSEVERLRGDVRGLRDVVSGSVRGLGMSASVGAKTRTGLPSEYGVTARVGAEDDGTTSRRTRYDGTDTLRRGQSDRQNPSERDSKRGVGGQEATGAATHAPDQARLDPDHVRNVLQHLLQGRLRLGLEDQSPSNPVQATSTTASSVHTISEALSFVRTIDSLVWRSFPRSSSVDVAPQTRRDEDIFADDNLARILRRVKAWERFVRETSMS